MPENSQRFFENKNCKFYPCHNIGDSVDFNCLFCFCPLYSMEYCPGDFTYTNVNGERVKDCKNCIFPHIPENYDIIIEILSWKNKK